MKSLWTVPTLQAQEEALAAQEVKRRRRQRGFTLVEMLAVVIILAIVAGIGFVVVNNQIEKARTNTNIANERTIVDAMQRYFIDHPTSPNSPSQSFDLNTLVTGGYLGGIPSDPWGSTNKYTATYSTDANNNVTIVITDPKSKTATFGVQSGTQQNGGTQGND